MKICVTSAGPSMDAPADPRFGRCQYFVIVDSETMEYESMPNPSINASGGAGIQAAQTVAGIGAGVVITGNLGPNATQTLKASGIKMVTGASGTVRDAVEQYKSGGFSQTTSPTVPEYSGRGGAGTGAGAGTGMGTGAGAGMDGGRGMGGGGGRGSGRGMGRYIDIGRGMGMEAPVTPVPASPATPPRTREPGTQSIESDIKTLESQMEQIKKRIEELKR
ncbi:MAG: Dinitrogenase iron-molybdenum cofactor [Candidatus Argoarchaeum ethanivorans]|uniref:Dinitrogenase iron-molybdenum cofactor n=1 Tax=Candidatus Argoarchaeum ethanivorans TaxID=2608793 RepID=A0A811TCX7_9EURY|nr:MAG: Dinitrogenase iron-molybdenum cofactor [Candidatus Argoarchaeum ethanivorans]